MRRKVLFYVLLGLATFGLSQFLGTWRAWRAAPSLEGGAAVAAVGLAVCGAMLALGFLLYEVDRAAGRVRHRIWIYERVLAGRWARAYGVAKTRVGQNREARRPDLVWPSPPAAEHGKRGR